MTLRKYSNTASPTIDYLTQLCRLELPPTVLSVALSEEIKSAFQSDAVTLLWLSTESKRVMMMHESAQQMSCAWSHADVIRQFFLGQFLSAELCGVIDVRHPLLELLAERCPSFSATCSASNRALLVKLKIANDVVGMILIHRHESRSFSTAEKAALCRLVPMIASALRIEENFNSCALATNESEAGLVLFNGAMEIQSASCRGWKLMQLAQFNDSSGDIASCHSGLIDRLRAHFGADGVSRTSQFVYQNSWGSFELVLHRLCDAEIQPNQALAVSIYRQEPLALNVLRGCRNVRLTEKQTEIALLLVKGHSYDVVAKQLRIRPTTVVDHVRKMYDKLGAVNRSELITALLLSAKHVRTALPLPQESLTWNDGRAVMHRELTNSRNRQTKETVRGNAI